MTTPTQAQIEAATEALQRMGGGAEAWQIRGMAEAALTAAAEAGENPLTEKVRQLTKLLDDQLGMPCEQIRHQQEIQAVIERCAQWHDKQEQMMVEAGDLIAAEWHRDSAAAIRALKQSDKPNFSVSRASLPTTTDR